jgi:hypothetical protein
MKLTLTIVAGEADDVGDEQEDKAKGSTDEDEDKSEDEDEEMEEPPSKKIPPVSEVRRGIRIFRGLEKTGTPVSINRDIYRECMLDRFSKSIFI